MLASIVTIRWFSARQALNCKTVISRKTERMCGPLRRRSVSKFVTVPPGHQMNVFDRKAKTRHKNLAASDPDGEVYDYLKSEEAVESLIQCDTSQGYLAHCKPPQDVPTTRMVVDEEFLPFADNSVDIFLSSLSLHWVNNLPGTFKQIQTALKPDGVFLGCVFGGETLYQLRGALQLAETEREGGFGAHVSPFVQPQDLGGLLHQAGFTMLTLDSDELVVNYPTAFHLMADLKGMAENNASWKRKSHLHRDSMVAAASVYQQLYGKDDGTVPATFHILSFIGWKPHPSQAKPAERGSQNVSFKDLASLTEPAKKT